MCPGRAPGDRFFFQSDVTRRVWKPGFGLDLENFDVCFDSQHLLVDSLLATYAWVRNARCREIRLANPLVASTRKNAR